MRWIVERKRDDFEDVGADRLDLHESGALIFTDADTEHPTIIYAPGQWITVVPEED